MLANSKHIVILTACLGVQLFLAAQPVITAASVEHRMNILAGDSLEGRGNGQPGILKAAAFISNSFKAAGLQPMPGQAGFYIPFRSFSGSRRAEQDILVWNGKKLSRDHFVFLSATPGEFVPKTLDHFAVQYAGASFTDTVFSALAGDTSAILLWTDKLPAGNNNPWPPSFTMPAGGLQRDVLLVYAGTAPVSLSLTPNPAVYKTFGYNIVAVLPGRSKKEETVIFSAHYDHLGKKAKGKNDNISNGANDNASGTVALLELADYFARKADNERTLVFCAFAGEELGLVGSGEFVKDIPLQNVITCVNIEMIAIPQVGAGKVFVTGRDHSAAGKMLADALKSAGIGVMDEPDLQKELYERSDNFQFVRKGIPSHTIMSSDDDDECYHKPCDEVKRIDIPHMVTVINGIAVAVQSFINGAARPAF